MHAERVLIVEDDLTWAEMFKQVMGLCFEVEHVTNLQRACARLGPGESAPSGESNKYDGPPIHCIILDLLLPNGRGVTLVDKFQNRYPAIPLVVVTGFEADEKEIIHAGAHAMLRKPYLSGMATLEAVQQTIARHQVRKTYEPLVATIQELKADQKEDAERLAAEKRELIAPHS